VKDRIEELAFITTGRVAGNKNVSAVEKMISETITLAVNEALELAARECDSIAWSNNNTAMLGPEYNSTKCAAAIRKLKV
jgi:hypothetical protein